MTPCWLRSRHLPEFQIREVSMSRQTPSPHVVHLSFAVFAAALLLCHPAHAATATAGDVIAQGGGVTLAGTDVRTLLQALPEAERKAVTADAGTLERLVRGEIANRALLAEARAKGFDKQADTQAQLARVRDEALLRLWVASQAAAPAGYPSEADIKAAYDANQQQLVAPTQYRIGQVYVALPDDPARLAAALKRAAEVSAKIATSDFGKLAADYSEHAESASRGGDMGYMTDTQLAPEVLAAVRTLKAGESVGPVRTAQGLHFFKLLDRKAGAVLTLAEAHDALASALRTRRANELGQAYLAALNARLATSVNQIELGRLQAAAR
jgi:parvulin-like peptidyl-prolyl isomerase